MWEAISVCSQAYAQRAFRNPRDLYYPARLCVQILYLIGCIRECSKLPLSPAGWLAFRLSETFAAESLQIFCRTHKKIRYLRKIIVDDQNMRCGPPCARVYQEL